MSSLTLNEWVYNIAEFYSLGLGDPYPVSAVNGYGTGDLLVVGLLDGQLYLLVDFGFEDIVGIHHPSAGVDDGEGTEARKDIETFFGKNVYLEMFVKVEPNWRNRESKLRQLPFIASTTKRISSACSMASSTCLLISASKISTSWTRW